MSGKAFRHIPAAERPSAAAIIKESYENEVRGELSSDVLLSIFRRYLPKKGKTVDLGSGNGKIFDVLKKLGVEEVHGADIGDYMTAARPSGKFSIFDFNFDEYPYSDGSFDAATAIEVVEHLENPFHFFRQIHRILKPGGILILSTPNLDHFFTKLTFFVRGAFHRFLPGNDHISPFARVTLEKGVLPHFLVVERNYWRGEMPYRFFAHLPLPATKLFGRTAIYVLRKK